MPVLHFEIMINFSRFIDVFIIFSENKYDLEEAESVTLHSHAFTTRVQN